MYPFFTGKEIKNKLKYCSVPLSHASDGVKVRVEFVQRTVLRQCGKADNHALALSCLDVAFCCFNQPALVWGEERHRKGLISYFS